MVMPLHWTNRLASEGLGKGVSRCCSAVSGRGRSTTNDDVGGNAHRYARAAPERHVRGAVSDWTRSANSPATPAVVYPGQTASCTLRGGIANDGQARTGCGSGHADEIGLPFKPPNRREDRSVPTIALPCWRDATLRARAVSRLECDFESA